MRDENTDKAVQPENIAGAEGLEDGLQQSEEQTGRPKMIECENLVKIYKTKDLEVVALQGLDLVVEAGELMAIIGNSGSGKSTLLNMLGGLDRPSAGKLYVDGHDLLKFNDQQLIKYKRDTVGFIWQNNGRNLVPYLTAQENVEMPMRLTGKMNVRSRALQLLDMVGLLNRRNNKLSQLSGGEQQRVAIAIALSNSPKLLLADEPTELNNTFGITVVIVTHDRQVSRKVDRVVAIRDGRTSSEFIRKVSYADELAEMGNLLTSHGDDAHEELVVLDRTGRLQIPADYIQALGLKGRNKVKVELEGDRVVMYAPEK